jgi:two-component system, LuxR family, sensor kinase FixL
MLMIGADVSKGQLISELNSIRQRVAEIELFVAEEKQPQELLSSLVFGSPAAIYVAQDGLFKFVSPQMCHITQYSEQELLGTGPVKLVFPEDRNAVTGHAVKLLRDGGSIVHEYRLLTKNAKLKWVMEALVPTSYEGKRALIANAIDITAHKQAEEEARSRDQKYWDLCENASDMIQCSAPDGRLVYVNRAWRERLGYSADEVGKLSIFEITQPDHRENCLRLFQRVMSGDKISNIEVVFIDKNGNGVPLEGNMNCRMSGGKPVYVRGIFRDITERKKTQQDTESLVNGIKEINRRLEQSNRELEDFAHVASHDLQEPLRKISSFGALLRDSLGDKLSEDDRENLDFMTDGARRMQLMIDDLLTYSRVTTRAKPFQQVDPNKVIGNLKNFELAAAIEEKHGVIHIPQPLSCVHSDPSQMHQLLQNLIGNALKFHRDGVPPVITISTHPMPNNMVSLEIQDNGIGIDKEYHDQIFTMFKRLHSREKYPGSGIGLAICKKIVQRHSGEIGVESKPGEGSKFWFTIPRWGDQPS